MRSNAQLTPLDRQIALPERWVTDRRAAGEAIKVSIWIDIQTPAISTVHAVLDRHGLGPRGRRRFRPKAEGTRLSKPRLPNDLWCADYKGESMLADLAIRSPSATSPAATSSVARHWPPQETYAFAVFERAFRDFGLPKAMRTDNGVPFASLHALYGLSKLAVWWLRLGVHIERIKPGHPTQNGRHERIHLTLKKEATKPAVQNLLQQQARFDDFMDGYNRERPTRRST